MIGYATDVSRYMCLADYFIGKPGPGCLSEALHMGLPVVTFCNAATMPQERYNTDWVRENGVGLVLESYRELRLGIERLLQRLPDMQASARRLNNRALFEVPELLAAQLRAAEPGASFRVSETGALTV